MEKRLEWLDYMKGVAIFLVILGHVYQTCLQDVGTVFSFIYTFHMPFFFMLSGVLAWRLVNRKILLSLQKKVRTLLLPFITCGLAFSLSYNRVGYFIYSEFHAGYWFLLSLFSCWLFFLPLIKIIKKIPYFKGKFVFEVVILIMPFWGGKLIMSHISSELVYMLSLNFTFPFYRFFLLGYFVGKLVIDYNLERKTQRKLISSVMFIGFILLMMCIFNKSPFLEYLTATGLQVLLCLGCFGTLLLYRQFAFGKEKTIIQHLGKNSLTIYCFHYFIFNLIDLSMLNGYSEGIKFIVAAITSMLVIGLVLLFVRPFENKYLSYLFLGKK